MSEMPPPAPPSDGPAEEKFPHEENANFFLYTVDFYRTVIEEVIAKIPPMELPFVMAFLQGAIESQNDIAAGAFEEAREFFRALYPPFMQGHLEAHPDDTPGEDQILIIIPTPSSTTISVNPEEPSRIITPGSSRVN